MVGCLEVGGGALLACSASWWRSLGQAQREHFARGVSTCFIPCFSLGNRRCRWEASGDPGRQTRRPAAHFEVCRDLVGSAAVKPKGYWFESSRGSHLRRSAAISAAWRTRPLTLYSRFSSFEPSLSASSRASAARRLVSLRAEVDVLGDRDASVAELVGHLARRQTRLVQDGRSGLAQVVGGDPGKAAVARACRMSRWTPLASRRPPKVFGKTGSSRRTPTMNLLRSIDIAQLGRGSSRSPVLAAAGYRAGGGVRRSVGLGRDPRWLHAAAGRLRTVQGRHCNRLRSGCGARYSSPRSTPCACRPRHTTTATSATLPRRPKPRESARVIAGISLGARPRQRRWKCRQCDPLDTRAHGMRLEILEPGQQMWASPFGLSIGNYSGFVNGAGSRGTDVGLH